LDVAALIAIAVQQHRNAVAQGPGKSTIAGTAVYSVFRDLCPADTHGGTPIVKEGDHHPGHS
jgi:hypothetical protein